MDIHDRVKGALYGFAFGDALGLGTEFMVRNEVKSYYPQGLRHFSQIIRDAHRSQWKRGEWTNDTELLLLQLESYIENDGFDMQAMARKLKEWHDSCDTDSCSLFRILMAIPGWIESPISVTHKAWLSHQIGVASNESIARGIVTGILSDAESLDEHTRRMVLITNDDSRCVSTATVIARMMNAILFRGTLADYNDLENYCCTADSRTVPLLRLARNGRLEELQLDDEDTCCWTRKAMAGPLWTLWHTDNAADAIYAMVDAGGDANTNASLAGALFGALQGYDAIPQEKELIIGKERLDDMADRIVDFINKNN